MKLLFLSNFYPPNVFGGYERLCHEVALGLADRGHEITVLTSNYGKFSDENYNHFVSRDLNIFANKDDIYKPFEISLEERNTLNIINSEIINKIISEKTPDVIFIWNLYFYDKPMIEQIQNIKLPKVYLLTDNWLIAELNNKYISHYFDSIIRESTISHQFYFVKFLCNFFNKFTHIFLCAFNLVSTYTFFVSNNFFKEV
jgi:hypothetical protein